MGQSHEWGGNRVNQSPQEIIWEWWEMMSLYMNMMIKTIFILHLGMIWQLSSLNTETDGKNLMISQQQMSQHLTIQRSWLLLFTKAVQCRQCKCIFLVILSSGSSQLAPTSSSPSALTSHPDHTSSLSRASANKPTNSLWSWAGERSDHFSSELFGFSRIELSSPLAIPAN